MVDGAPPARHLPTLSVADTLSVLARVVAPTFAKGLLIRRPAVVALAARLEADRAAVRCMEGLRERYGDGPVLLNIPKRRQAVLLAPEHVPLALRAATAVITPASDEKRSALAHFEPEAVLVSDEADRAERRAFNEAVLEPGTVNHPLAARLRAVVDEEAIDLRRRATLEWSAFDAAWQRCVRRIVLGDVAAGDTALTEHLAQLRRAGNWAFFRRIDKASRARFHDHLTAVLGHAAPDSLAARAAAARPSARTAVSHQAAHWLFAFDAAGITIFRALAVLACQDEPRARVRAEIGTGPDLPFLRACILETLRLWPTTPALLRQTQAPTLWDGRTMETGTSLFIFTPYFHRARDLGPRADSFQPEAWLEGAPGRFVPFSDGPAQCPARHFVPMVSAFMLAALLEGEGGWRLLDGPRLTPDGPLPGTLNHAGLRLARR